MSWYKRSNSARLTETVRKWLIQSQNSVPSFAMIDADLSAFAPSGDDGQSIEMGANLAVSQLHLTEMTPAMSTVLDYIRSRVNFIGDAPAETSVQQNDAGQYGNVGDAQEPPLTTV
jgi:hypothetical protein